MNFERIISPKNTDIEFATPTSAKPRCVVVKIGDMASHKADMPKNYSSISTVISKLDRTREDHAALEDARRWIADAFYIDVGLTIRTMRLRNGWSQMGLAEKLGTSQSHVARIERGTENLAITTCRRLCTVFNIDMNTLNDALQRQEDLLTKKRKK